MSEENQQSATENTEQTATPATPGTEQSVQTDTQTSDGEANKQSATDEVKFLTEEDLKTLPPSQRKPHIEVNKNMVRGFTEKTQKLAEERKKFEGESASLRQKADLYDKALKEYQGQQQQGKTQQPDVKEPTKEEWDEAQLDPSKMPDLVKRQNEAANYERDRRLEKAEQQAKYAETQTLFNVFKDAVNDKGEKLHPNFERLTEVGEGQNGVNLINYFLATTTYDDYSLALEDAYQKADAAWNHIHAQGKNEGLGIIKKKVANNSEVPSVSAGTTLQSGDPSNISDAAAISAAKRGQRVS